MRKRQMILIAGLALAISLAALGTALASRSLQTRNAAVPSQVTFQAVLRDSQGQIVRGQHDLTFSIYSDCTARVKQWEELHTVSTPNGFVTVLLGSAGSPLTPDAFESGDACYTTKVGTEPESSALPFTTVPYAFIAEQAAEAVLAENANNLGGRPASDYALAGHAHTGTTQAPQSQGGLPSITQTQRAPTTAMPFTGGTTGTVSPSQAPTSQAVTSKKPDLSRIQRAHDIDDQNAYNSILNSYVSNIPRDTTVIRKELDDAIDFANKSGNKGIEPIIGAYVSELLKQDGLTAQRASQKFDGSPLEWERFLCLNDESRVIQDSQRIATGQTGTTGAQAPNGDCIDLGEPKFNLLTLSNDLVLPEVQVGRAFSIVLDIPGSPDDADIPPGALPGNLLHQFDATTKQLAIYTPLLTRMTGPARTQVFTITVEKVGVPDVNFTATLPVKPSVHGDYLYVLNPSQGVDIFLEASGGPDSCATLTPAGASQNLPCGSFTWNWSAVEGATDLPGATGLTQTSPSNGVLRLSGTIPEGAISSRGRWEIQQGSGSAFGSASFEVPVHFTAGELATVTAGRFEIERDKALSPPVQLPEALGGDGTNYFWDVQYTLQRQLPSGLQSPQGSGNNWSLGGTVASDAPIGSYTAQLNVSSTLGGGATVPLDFRLTVPVTVWTQNTIMRPPDLPQAIEDAIDSASTGLGVFFGLVLGGPIGAIIGGAVGSEASDELVALAQEEYRMNVQNTHVDNNDRMNKIIAEVHDSGYDIVGLQEVFDKVVENQLTSGVVGTHHVLLGPPAAEISEATELGTSSGLALLVRRDLARDPQLDALPSATRDSSYHTDFFEHSSEIFQLATGFDVLAQKGFTYDKVHIGPDPNDYIHVITTHTQADSDQSAIRLAQFIQLQGFIDANWDSTHPLLIMGDFNVIEQAFEYTQMLVTLGLGTPFSPQRIEPLDIFRNTWDQRDTFGNLAVDGFTIDDSINAYSRNWRPAGTPFAQERLDYILLYQGTNLQIEVDSVDVKDNDYRGFEMSTNVCQGWFSGGRNPSTLRCYISDHFGIETNLRLVRP